MSGFLTIPQAAERVNKTERTIRNWITGGLPYVLGHIVEADLLAFARRMRSRRGRPLKWSVLDEVAAERATQDSKWGQQNHPDGTGPTDQALGDVLIAKIRTTKAAREGTLTWRHILLEEVFEAFAESDLVKLRAELVQVAAVAVAWVEAIDRRPAGGEE